jgi:hypothetical protein
VGVGLAGLGSSLDRLLPEQKLVGLRWQCPENISLLNSASAQLQLRTGFIDQMRDFTVSVYWARGPIAVGRIQVTRRDEDQREIQLTATDARQGTTPHVTRYVLTWGLGLVIVAFLMIYLLQR